MKNILVIGGAGFIGSHTVRKLIESGHHPIIIDEKYTIDAVKKLHKTFKLDW